MDLEIKCLYNIIIICIIDWFAILEEETLETDRKNDLRYNNYTVL